MILNRMDANLCRLIFALFLATLDIALCLFLGLFHRIFPVLLLLAILSRSFAIFGFVALTSVFVLLSLSFSIHNPLVDFGNLVVLLKVLPKSVSYFRPHIFFLLFG